MKSVHKINGYVVVGTNVRCNECTTRWSCGESEFCRQYEVWAEKDGVVKASFTTVATAVDWCEKN